MVVHEPIGKREWSSDRRGVWASLGPRRADRCGLFAYWPSGKVGPISPFFQGTYCPSRHLPI